MASPAVRLLTSAIFLIVTMTASGPVAAQSRYDGSWSVLIVTDAGNCDPSYRFGIRIAGGRIYDESGSGAAVAGQVNNRGQVRVSVSQGNSSAFGTGVLSRATGGGRWQGVSDGSRCAGRWRADRRG